MTARSKLNRNIEDLCAELQAENVLRTIPDIGQYLAPDLFGMLPRRRSDSGGAEKPGQRITQGGNDFIEPAQVLTADTARKIDPDRAAVY